MLAHLALPSFDQPCRHCAHYGGQAWGDVSVAWCLRLEKRQCVSQPERGCAFWLREPGADDDNQAQEATQP